jgi:DHA2 family multidrug resistance protein-like MFS transporter
MTTAAEARAGRREWTGLAVLALSTLLVSMDLTVLNLAVPHLSADLEPTSSQLLWIVDIYAFLHAGSLVTMGTLGDRIGRRRLLLIGAAGFGVASAAAAFSSSAEMLIATRALLGVAGATLMPSALSLTSSMFLQPRQRTVAIGVVISSFSGGTALGPLVGGWVLEHFWWGSAFLLGLPVMVLLLAVGPALLPEYHNPHAGRLDLFSAGLSLAAVLLVIYGLKQLAQDGPGWAPALSVLAGLAVGAAFVRRQRALPDPLLDLRLFRILDFSTALGALMLGIFVLFGAYFHIAQYLQLVLGLSPLEAGLWTAPSAAGTIAGSMLATRIVRRVRPALVIGAGLALTAVGFGMLTQVDGSSGLAVVVAGSVVISAGLGPLMTLATDLVVGAAPPERSGAAAALSETSGVLGGALGIAILGSIGTAIYRSQVAGTLPAAAPLKATQAAHDTLGGAVAAAGELPDQFSQALLAATREAFTVGLHLTAAVSAAMMAATAILTAVLLRHARATAERQDRADQEQEQATAA